MTVLKMRKVRVVFGDNFDKFDPLFPPDVWWDRHSSWENSSGGASLNDPQMVAISDIYWKFSVGKMWGTGSGWVYSDITITTVWPVSSAESPEGWWNVWIAQIFLFKPIRIWMSLGLWQGWQYCLGVSRWISVPIATSSISRRWSGRQIELPIQQI